MGDCSEAAAGCLEADVSFGKFQRRSSGCCLRGCDVPRLGVIEIDNEKKKCYSWFDPSTQMSTNMIFFTRHFESLYVLPIQYFYIQIPSQHFNIMSFEW